MSKDHGTSRQLHVQADGCWPRLPAWEKDPSQRCQGGFVAIASHGNGVVMATDDLLCMSESLWQRAFCYACQN